MGHSHCCLLYHLVFSTKERLPQLHGPFQDRMFEYLGGAIKSEGGVIIAAGGMEDHTHLFAKLRQDKAVCDGLRDIKANSSKWAHEVVGLPEFAWQVGYGAFSVSESQAKRVCGYVRGQAQHHAKMSFQDEFRGLLRAHKIEYDERYIWD